MNICVIPARGGSKRIPRKNIRPFCGKPMIGWSIEAAMRSNCFDEVIVSTDDGEIAEISKGFGATIPFTRPAELADDHTGTIPVIAHAGNWLIRNGYEPRYICCIYPTAPFLKEENVQQGLKKLCVEKCSYAISVTTYAFPIQRAVKLTGDGRIQMLDPQDYNTRSQDLEETYHDAGQFYWGTAEAWISRKMLFDIDSTAVVLPRWEVLDIDTLEDWELAERLFKANR